MALGGNLKKKTLLPEKSSEEQEKVVSKQAAAKDKPVAKRTNTKKTTKKTTRKTTKKGGTKKPATKKPETKKKEPIKAPIEEKTEVEEMNVVEETQAETPVTEPKEKKTDPEPVVVPVPATYEQETRPKTVVEQVFIEAPVVEQPKGREGLLTKIEYERRQKLHAKFSEEIGALEGKQVHLIIFRIEQELFALEIAKVNEVVVTPDITRMPQAPKYIPGISTIRGKGIVTLDLAYKLGYVESRDDLKDRSQYTIVIKTEKFTIGVLVPEVPVSHIVSGSEIQTAHDNVSETSLDETYVKGLFRTENEMVFFIDIDEMIEGDRLKSRLAE